jgi:hypothetical protein
MFHAAIETFMAEACPTAKNDTKKKKAMIS